MPPHNPDSLTLDILQANVALLAATERLERDKAHLIEIDRIRTEFLARISHDLRTPLSSIIGFSDLILSDDGGRLPAKHRDYLDAIHRNGHVLLGLINDLLDLSGMELKRITVRRSLVDVADVLHDVRSATDPLLRQAGLQVGWQEPSSLAGRVAHIDRKRIVQALVNLVDNSRKFTPRGGHVALTIEVDEHELRILISDSGPGIPLSHLPTLFHPFASGQTGSRNEGTGLGLAIVKAIIDQHHGTIELLGGSERRGCSFRIRIPQEMPTPVLPNVLPLTATSPACETTP